MPEIIKILPYPSNLDYTKQSYEVPGTKRPGQTGHYRDEWQIIDLACQAYRKVSVSLYDTLGPDAVGQSSSELFVLRVLDPDFRFNLKEYIINHAEIPIIFATAQHLPSLLSLSPKTPTVKVIVSIDPLPEETRKVLSAWGKEKGIEIFDFKEIEELGKAHHQEPIPPASPDEVTSICYTSGTTNVPKGVVLTHKNLVSAALSNAHGGSMVNGASMISYLPLAHIYERVAEIVVYAIGGRIGYYSGDPLRLIEDTQILKPYWFPSVPRVLNRLYMAAMQNTKAPGMKGALFRRALDAKLQNFNATGATTHRMWDALVFKKVRAVLGGEIGFITSGSAPISKDCLNFLRIAFAPAIVIEGMSSSFVNNQVSTAQLSFE
ncbi:hypothetical protein FRC03_011236 [Tulasnella sp. 419]|nr:hypothetical protein FRC03_011236 [Tulasnella sp. 419]